nr:endolytic transglycosylase MltG [Priestia koreensis]
MSDEQKPNSMPAMWNGQPPNKRKRRMWIILSSIVGVIVLVLAGLFLYIHSALQPVNEQSKKSVEVTIPPGSSVSAISQELEKQGVIKNGTIFRYYVKFNDKGNFQAGTYSFSKAMDIDQMINMMTKGDVSKNAKIKLAIPEGTQLTQIAAIIAKHTQYKETDVLALANSSSFINGLMKKYPKLVTKEVLNKDVKYPLEGYFYPATYQFYDEKVSLHDILDKMINRTDNTLQKYQDDMKKKNYSAHKVLTMSSLVEEEATNKTEREKIASVFYNRLHDKMPLQTDPTVLYALGEHKKRVLYKHLEVDSPYNTYKVKGLPPGPISNAGEMSIKAALHPATTKYLYFLATPSGDVIFSTTLQEHNKQKAIHITNKK